MHRRRDLSEAEMKVAVEKSRSAREPSLEVHDEHVLAMVLHPGAVEVGPRLSEMRGVTSQAGEMGLSPRHTKRWVGAADQERLVLGISDAALMAACEGMSCG